MSRYGVFFVVYCDRVVHHVKFRPRQTRRSRRLRLHQRRSHARSKVSVRNVSPVIMTAHTIRASLLASATVTSLAGLRARRATIQSRKTPFRLPATRSNEVAPSTSSRLM